MSSIYSDHQLRPDRGSFRSFFGVATFGAVVGIVALGIGFFNSKNVDAGQVGVFKYQPYFFGKGGVDNDVVTGPDLKYMWPSTTLVRVSTVPQTITVHAEDFMTKDRVPLDFDVAITIRMTEPAKAPELIRTFGADTEPAFRTLVLQQRGNAATGELMSFLRDQVRHYHSAVFIAAQNEDGTPSDSAARVENETAGYINKFLTERGASMIKVENIALGRANPPDGVRRTIEATAQQAQEVKTQQERLRAANARALAETAVAAADNAYLNAMHFSGEQFIQLERLKVQREVCKSNLCIFNESQAPVALIPPTQRAGLPAPSTVAQK